MLPFCMIPGGWLDVALYICSISMDLIMNGFDSEECDVLEK